MCGMTTHLKCKASSCASDVSFRALAPALGRSRLRCVKLSVPLLTWPHDLQQVQRVCRMSCAGRTTLAQHVLSCACPGPALGTLSSSELHQHPAGALALAA